MIVSEEIFFFLGTTSTYIAPSLIRNKNTGYHVRVLQYCSVVVQWWYYWSYRVVTLQGLSGLVLLHGLALSLSISLIFCDKRYNI